MYTVHLLVLLGVAGITPATSVDCPDVPAVKHAEHKIQDDNTVKYKCTSGYRSCKECKTSSIKCSNGVWSSLDKVPMSCRLVRCSSPPDIRNAYYTERVFDMGVVVYYKCAEGYKQVSGILDYVQCQPNMQWTVIGFSCGRITCPKLSTPAHSTKFHSGAANYDYGKEYTFTCNEGLTTKFGDRVTVRCQGDGTWSKNMSEIVCEDTVCPLPSYPNAIADPNAIRPKYLVGAIIGYDCAAHADPGHFDIICQFSGRWSIPKIACLPKQPTCGRPLSPPNSIPVKNKDKYGNTEVESFRCSSGYSGSPTAKCTAGVWTPDGTTCKLTGCLALPHSNMNGAMNQNAEKTITCDPGYTAKGRTMAIKCVAGVIQNIEGGLFNCEASDCKAPPNIQHGSYAETGEGQFLYGGAGVKYVCDAGYAFNGRSEVAINCLETRKWSIEDVSCEKVFCVEPPVPANSVLKPSGNQLIVGSKREYECNNGFTVEGSGGTSISLECQLTGAWTPADIKCVRAAQCVEPPVPANSVLKPSGNQLIVGSKREYECNSGFTVEGSGGTSISLECQSTGAWTPADIKCVRAAQCVEPPLPANSVLKPSGNQLIVGSKREYECNSGFTVEGSGGTSISLECQLTGAWTPAVVECVRTAVVTEAPSTSTTSSATKFTFAWQMFVAMAAVLLCCHC